jgi:hypothetical protein
MSRPGVVLLITTGVVIASHYLPSPESSLDLTEITRISVAPDRDYRSSDVIPTFAPTSSAFREVISGDTDQPAARPLPKPGTWSTVVSAERSIVSPVSSSRAADPATRSQLARDLQQELQRVGCYQGEITGSWNSATRRAMSAFMDRANAVLPFNEPDYVLLALVQSHHEVACAADCPTGQVMQDGGRCLPAAVVAQTSKRQKRLQERQIAQARREESARERLASSATTEPEVLPWQRNRAVAVRSEDIALAPRPDPLPGRMSIGGPALPPDAVPVAQAERGVAPPPIAGLPGGSAGSAKVAALQYEPDADPLVNDDSADAVDAPADMPAAAPPADVKQHKAKKSRRSDGERRRGYDSYAYSGKRRHGQPRMGTARFNLLQSLGGIY